MHRFFAPKVQGKLAQGKLAQRAPPRESENELICTLKQ
jgi:hypothetical protein